MREETRHDEVRQERHDGVRQEEDRPPWIRIGLVAFAAIGISAILALLSGVLLAERWRALRPSGRFPERELTLAGEVSAVQRELFFEESGPGQRLLARKREELSSFGWADQGRGLVNIPIEEGMRLRVEEGER